MNTLFDLEALETKAQAQQRQPASKPPRYWIEVECDGARAAYMGANGRGDIRFMWIRPGKKQRQPKLYKTLRGAEYALKDIGRGVVRAWTGSYEAQS